MALVTQHRYTVILERENDGGFHAFVPTEALLIRPVEVGV
jgi:hypothetical protein